MPRDDVDLLLYDGHPFMPPADAPQPGALVRMTDQRMMRVIAASAFSPLLHVYRASVVEIGGPMPEKTEPWHCVVWLSRAAGQTSVNAWQEALLPRPAYVEGGTRTPYRSPRQPGQR